ncbi:hypothetical protein AMECASPLE_037878 [Ameca splendens]|uniref:Uncharacterized protein n=1 Tax=Ameca splendens TaxID=208324 RepID=A0ABV1AF30_9TELE
MVQCVFVSGGTLNMLSVFGEFIGEVCVVKISQYYDETEKHVKHTGHSWETLLQAFILLRYNALQKYTRGQCSSGGAAEIRRWKTLLMVLLAVHSANLVFMKEKLGKI